MYQEKSYIQAFMSWRQVNCILLCVYDNNENNVFTGPLKI